MSIILVANKKDLANADALSAREAGMQKAKELGALYVETSAATGENINEAFSMLVRSIRENKKKARLGRHNTGQSSANSSSGGGGKKCLIS